jgi:hypothetical protein
MGNQSKARLIKESGFLILLLILGGCSMLPETSTLRYNCYDIRHDGADREWWCKKDQMYFQCKTIEGEPSEEETQEEGSEGSSTEDGASTSTTE